MRVAILFNRDFDHLDDDPGRAAREDVVQVAASLSSALQTAGLTPELIALGAKPFSAIEALLHAPPDAVVNLCESLAGDARGECVVPSLLELSGIPYTGSSSLGLLLALHKPKAKELLRAHGVPTPDWAVLGSAAEARACTLPFPLIVKPSREDASSGIHPHSVARDSAQLAAAVESVVRDFEQPALVERFIEGREFNVALFGAPLRALPLAEIDFSGLPTHLPPIVTYAGKWDEGSAECLHTPVIASASSGDEAARIERAALAAFEALDCRDYGRVDIRLAADGTPYVIDVNPNCDLSPTAGFARAAARGGWSYPALARELIEVARRRHGDSTPEARRPGLPLLAAAAHPAIHAG